MADVDLSPPEFNVSVHADGTDVLTFYKSDGAGGKQSLAGYSSPSAFWVPEIGSVDSVDLAPVVVGDTVVVTLTEVLKGQLSESSGFFIVKIVDPDGEPDVLGKGQMHLCPAVVG